MRDLRGTKQQITGADIGHLVFNPVASGAAGDHVQFVAWMGNLRTVGGTSREADFQITSINTSAERPGVRGSARAAASDRGAGVRSMTNPGKVDLPPSF